MPIFALEGPNAAGKTTVAAALAASDNAFVVPEVNVLFERPPDEPPDWYLERQAERRDMSARAEQSNGLVILEGDPFQPLWYNWAYDFEGWQPLDELVRFYRPRIARGERFSSGWRRSPLSQRLRILLRGISRTGGRDVQEDVDPVRSRAHDCIMRARTHGFVNDWAVSNTPRWGITRIRQIGAVRTCADRTSKVLAELRMVFGDPVHRLADGAGHTGSSALGRGCGPASATT